MRSLTLRRTTEDRSARRRAHGNDLRISYPRAGCVELTSATLFTDPASPGCRRFVGRLFSVPEIESLAIGASTVEIRYAPERTTVPTLVRRIATALRSGGGAGRSSALYLSAPAGVVVWVRRHGAALSTWELRHALPGRLRLRHPCLRGRRGVIDAVLEELTALPGVLECRASVYTGSLLVLHDPERLGSDELLRVCEAALYRADTRDVPVPSLSRVTVTTAIYGLAVAGHFVYPPLLLLCAALLVGANLGTFARAGRALRRATLDDTVLYSTHITATLLSGNLLAISSMAWCVATWPVVLDRRLAAARHALTGERERLARAVVMPRVGRPLTTGMAALRAGDLTIVEAGATVPADGVVLEGAATVDESYLTGERDLADKEPGLAVYAGTRVVTGRLVLEITRGERDSVASEIRRHLLAATRITPEDAGAGGTLARRSAAPILALAAVGGMTRGLGTVTAVLAPNYRMAPVMAASFGRSATLIRCAGVGVLVRDEAALARLAAIDAVVIDAGVAESEATVLAGGLRARGIGRILVVSRPHRVRLLRRLRQEGHRVALIGPGTDTATARETEVVIALGGAPARLPDAAEVVLVTPRLERTLDVLDLARAHVRETRTDVQLGFWANAAAVGGALLLGSVGTTSVLLSNLGAFAVYWRGGKRLGEAEADWRARRR